MTDKVELTHEQKLALIMGFFKARGEPHVEKSEGDIGSPQGLVHRVINFSMPDQVHRPKSQDDGRRIVAYSHQYISGVGTDRTESSQVDHWSANRVDGKEQRQIGLTKLFAATRSAEHYDNHPRLIGRTTLDENGKAVTEQLYKPEQPETRPEDTRTVAERLSADSSAQIPTAAMRRFREELQPTAVAVDMEFDISG
jgi:hypothetical protein